MAKSIVDQLRRAIRASGQTEYAIAKGSGVSQSIVNRFVSGERGISFQFGGLRIKGIREIIVRGAKLEN